MIGMSRREEDVADTMFTCSTHDYVMFFTSDGRVFRLKGYEIPEGSRTSKGMNIVNLLPITTDVKINAMIRVPEVANGEYLCMVTRKGIIKRTELEAYRNVRKNGVIAINLDEEDELAWVHLTSGSDDLLVATRKGMSIRFHEEDARPLGRTARGVKAIELAPGDEVVGMAVLKGEGTVLTVSETGYGRRSEASDYRLQSRAGKGTINYHTEKYGNVAAVRMIQENEDVILISSDGIIIRIPSDEIRLCARPSKGVRVMRVNEGERVATLTSAEHDDGEKSDSLPAEQAEQEPQENVQEEPVAQAEEEE